MKLWSLLILLVSQTALFAQNIKPEERLILNDSLVFMGIDFSVAKFYNPDKFGQGIYIRDRHGPIWGQIDDYLLKGDLKYDFQKKFINPMGFLFDSSFKELDSTWLIKDHYKGLSDEEITAHIKKYPWLHAQRLGLVILVDQLNEVNKLATICVAYVDLNDKSVIKIIRAEGWGSGYGYSSFWKTGVENAYHDFILKDDKYLKELRKFFK